MPEALDLLKTRRSVKPIELTGPAPVPAELDTLLTVASRVPDHGKLTPWRFIVFEGGARLKAAPRSCLLPDHPAPRLGVPDTKEGAPGAPSRTSNPGGG